MEAAAQGLPTGAAPCLSSLISPARGNSVYLLQDRRRRASHVIPGGRSSYGLCVRMGLHPDWRQIDNKVRRMEYRITDFRILSNDLRINRGKLSSDDPSINREKLLEYIKKKEEEVLAERAAIQTEMEKLTVYFHKGAELEYKGLRKFFLSYLYHTSRNAFLHLKNSEFDSLLFESNEGITYDEPQRGTVRFPPHLCKKVALGQKISISASGLDTSPLAIALAIIQAGAKKHCDNMACRKEECLILKDEYEQLFEAFFKKRVRPLINQKARGEMPAQYDTILKIERSTAVEVS